MNKDEQIFVIYQRFLQNSATKEELHKLFQYLDKSSEQELKQLLAEALGQPEIDVEADANFALLQNVRAKIMHEAESEMATVITLQPRKRKAWYYAAASVALVLSIGGLLLLNKKQTTQHTTDLQPGGNMAMLSVGGNDTLNLQTSNLGGFIKKTAGVNIAKTSNGTITYTAYGTDTLALSQINTLITPRGGQYHVRLSDGTEVLLNSESKLEFPVGFTGNERKVTLTGEAYFEVAKNKQKPFIVTTAGQDVQVLGTKFNISNFAEDGGPVTTLTEGSVKVSSHNQTAILKPGQQSRAKVAGITVTDVDADTYSAWKNGEFVFENESLDVIMHKLSRWYNFETDYSKLPQKSLYMKISRQVNLSEVLGMITTTSGIKFRIDERRVSVM
ncbi:FecR family protein [Mucilaginibacter terrae]|uniref:Transmembrane sensor n=1 Tax=Mucilaginibacter terrae TaxID=1955052 RepID=A0ABU3GQ89_9SPHI|nr:FecR domain-containing protein [Mucilaginibacter terrae]MDT3401948.1 transmembrane sensor [Mucilaginibacter terrae]